MITLTLSSHDEPKNMKIVDINGNLRECVRVYLDDKWPGFVSIDFESKLRTGYKHTEYYPVEDFRKNNPDLEYLVKDVAREANEVAGVVSSSDNASLTDKTQKWQENIYAGFPVWISRGRGEGQTRTVLSNSKDTIIIDKAWDVKPNKFSQYVLSRNIKDNMPAAGNILPQEEIANVEKKAKQMDKEYQKNNQVIKVNAR